MVSHDNPGQMIYSYTIKNKTLSIPLHCKELETLVYPILFPHGENGWSKEIKNTVKYIPYLASRLLMPERDSSSSTGWLERENKAGNLLRTNRFQLMSRAMQHYIVEGVSRLVDSHLSFIKANNGFIQGDYIENANTNDGFLPVEVDNLREEFNGSSKTFLNDSVTGSPRHLKACAKNALLIVEEMDKPHGFLTLTANPYWPEIVERLFPGQTAYDRYLFFI